MMENIKEIPYGIANFVEVAEQNMYYVDKTMYLPLLEKHGAYLIRRSATVCATLQSSVRTSHASEKFAPPVSA